MNNIRPWVRGPFFLKGQIFWTCLLNKMTWRCVNGVILLLIQGSITEPELALLILRHTSGSANNVSSFFFFFFTPNYIWDWPKENQTPQSGRKLMYETCDMWEVIICSWQGLVLSWYPFYFLVYVYFSAKHSVSPYRSIKKTVCSKKEGLFSWQDRM